MAQSDFNQSRQLKINFASFWDFLREKRKKKFEFQDTKQITTIDNYQNSRYQVAGDTPTCVSKSKWVKKNNSFWNFFLVW